MRCPVRNGEIYRELEGRRRYVAVVDAGGWPYVVRIQFAEKKQPVRVSYLTLFKRFERIGMGDPVTA